MRRNERKPRPGRRTDGGSHPAEAKLREVEARRFDRELRNLHEKYGDDVNIPEEWLQLARRIADAYERTDPETGSDGNHTV